jgi:hypothetical protein
VVRGGLERDVERDLDAELACAGHEVVEVVEAAEVGVDRVVPAVGRADAVRRARVALERRERVVAALAVGQADRVDRGQVHDVEAQVRDPVQIGLGRPQGAGHHRAADRVAVGAE